VLPKEIAERFRDIEQRLEEEYILRGLQVVEPRIQDLRASSYGETSIFQCKVNVPGLEYRRVPLNYLGSGVYRYFEILVILVHSRDGIVLIDEIENGIHHSVMAKVWDAIDLLAEELNVQVYATTHSSECIGAAYQALKDRGSLRLHRLQEHDGTIEAVTYTEEALAGAVDYDIEVR
jgi:AAA15 family ATPase/GTPase